MKDKPTLQNEMNSYSYQNMILTSILNSTRDLIFYKDYTNKNGEYMGCNNAFSKFVGRAKSEIIGKNDIELFGEALGKFFRDKDRAVIKNNAHIINEEWVTYPNGEKVLLSTNKSLFRDKADNVIGIMGISRDITKEYHYKCELEKQMERNRILANMDPLTGLANKRYFFKRAEKMLISAREKNLPLSLMMIDIDFFKKINDIYGHMVGDQALKYTAKTLQELLREEDLVCRFGGEEFIILLPDISLKKSKKVAEKIRCYFADTDWHYNDIPIPIRISIGVGIYEQESHLKELIHRVDKNLYKAKENGRNRVVL